MAQSQRSEAVVAYHNASKHHINRYAPGPDDVDWDTQPSPFRHFTGTPRLSLPTAADSLKTRFGGISGTAAPLPITLTNLAVLLELSLGLSAWKTLGPDQWSLRCAPSSGGLYPTEGYVLAAGVPGLVDGLWHYCAKDHALEHRAAGRFASTGLWLGLSSVHARETWKYGVRAYRYSLLDAGHVAGAISYAAAALNWRTLMVPGTEDAALAALLGTDRDADYGDAERESPEILLQIRPSGTNRASPEVQLSNWQGKASRCDPQPQQLWPQIDHAIAATGSGITGPDQALPPMQPTAGLRRTRAADVIRARRSARRFTSKQMMPAEDLFALLSHVVPSDSAPWNVQTHTPSAHLILFVHKVDGLAPGLYLMPRRSGISAEMRAALDQTFQWTEVSARPRLIRLHKDNLRPQARRLSCGQGVAAEGGVTFAMLCDFAPEIDTTPAMYRHLHYECGTVGQALYLAATDMGLGATGIGCFLDDEMHNLLGLTSNRFQVLYNFSVGYAVADNDITPHQHLKRPPTLSMTGQ